MTLYDTRMGSIYGDVSGIPAQVQERKMLAQRLLLNPEQMPQGQMISGHYVPPSWTQQLASAIKGPLARSELNAANKQLGEYNDKKRQDIAAILSGQSPQTIQTGGQQSMPAYTPDQMDRFGSPMPGAQREPITTQQTRTETPEEVQARLRPLIYQAASQYGNDPALQLMLGDLNYGRQRSDARADKIEDRTYAEGIEDKRYTRNRADTVADREDTQNFQATQNQLTRDQQTALQNAGFSHAEIMQLANQRFQAGQSALSRQQQERLAGANQAPVSVMGADGKPVYVDRRQAVGMSPYSAADDAKAIAATAKESAKQEGAGIVDSNIATLRDAYDYLDKNGGITNPQNNVLTNIGAKASASGIGQILGGAVGTNNQTKRDIIEQTRPLLLQSIMKATGMSAKQMDSNTELKLWLSTATDPTKSVEANRAALDNIERTYGSGAGNPSITGVQINSGVKKYNPKTGRIE